MSTTSLLNVMRRNLVPPNRLAGRLGLQSLLFALGKGAFMTGSAVFFTTIVGLQATEVGLGLTIAGVAGFLATLPSGRVVDLVGPRRVWAMSALAQALLFATWPLIDTFVGYVVMACAVDVVGALGGTAYLVYSIDALPRKERVVSRAFSHAALNLGFTVGALLGGIALGTHSDAVMRALPEFVAFIFLVNSYFITRLPSAPHDLKTQKERKKRSEGPGPFRNIGWLATSFFVGILWTNQTLLQTVVPLWVVLKTDSPREIVALLFTLNTVMSIVFPMSVSRSVKNFSAALRALRISTLLLVVGCLLTLAAHGAVAWPTVGLLALGYVAMTGAELYFSAGVWTFESDLMDPRQRGAYQGAGETLRTAGRFWAPAAYTFLAIEWHPAGWLVIAGVIVLATTALHVTGPMARAFLNRNVPAEHLADVPR